MRIVIQRCYDASVSVNGQIVGKINKGIMILVGFTKGDNEQILNKMAYKTANMRIFEDENSKMNKNLKAINGDVLSISQLHYMLITKMVIDLALLKHLTLIMLIIYIINLMKF